MQIAMSDSVSDPNFLTVLSYWYKSNTRGYTGSKPRIQQAYLQNLLDVAGNERFGERPEFLDSTELLVQMKQKRVYGVETPHPYLQNLLDIDSNERFGERPKFLDSIGKTAVFHELEHNVEIILGLDCRKVFHDIWVV